MERMRPAVTIAIPTYQRADGHLRHAIACALGQSFTDIEVVVSDNASPDHTAQVVGEFRDQRLRYFRQARNIGAHHNFNFCLSQARGRHFLLLHDDDLIDPDFVAACIDALPSHGEVGVVRSGTRVIGPDGEVLSEHPNQVAGLSERDFLLGWFTGRTALYLCSTLYHTAALREDGGFHSPAGLFQDGVATVRLAHRLGRADVRAVKASFRRHPYNRGSGASVAAWVSDCRYLRDLILSLVPDPDGELERVAQRYFARKCWRAAAAVPGFWRRAAAFGRVWGGLGFGAGSRWGNGPRAQRQ